MAGWIPLCWMCEVGRIQEVFVLLRLIRGEEKVLMLRVADKLKEFIDG